MNIRPARPGDRNEVLQLVPRLAEQGTPAGRDRQQIAAVDLETIAAVLEQRPPQAEVLVAEADGRVLGFVHVRTVVDYYTQKPIGHVSDLVVAERAQGAGVGRALLDAAHVWARAQGYSLMQLFVLPENVDARRLYERMDYHAEWIKYVRPLA